MPRVTASSAPWKANSCVVVPNDLTKNLRPLISPSSPVLLESPSPPHPQIIVEDISYAPLKPSAAVPLVNLENSSSASSSSSCTAAASSSLSSSASSSHAAVDFPPTLKRTFFQYLQKYSLCHSIVINQGVFPTNPTERGTGGVGGGHRKGAHSFHHSSSSSSRNSSASHLSFSAFHQSNFCGNRGNNNPHDFMKCTSMTFSYSSSSSHYSGTSRFSSSLSSCFPSAGIHPDPRSLADYWDRPILHPLPTPHHYHSASISSSSASLPHGRINSTSPSVSKPHSSSSAAAIGAVSTPPPTAATHLHPVSSSKAAGAGAGASMNPHENYVPASVSSSLVACGGSEVMNSTSLWLDRRHPTTSQFRDVCTQHIIGTLFLLDVNSKQKLASCDFAIRVSSSDFIGNWCRVVGLSASAEVQEDEAREALVKIVLWILCLELTWHLQEEIWKYFCGLQAGPLHLPFVEYPVDAEMYKPTPPSSSGGCFISSTEEDEKHQKHVCGGGGEGYAADKRGKVIVEGGGGGERQIITRQQQPTTSYSSSSIPAAAAAAIPHRHYSSPPHSSQYSTICSSSSPPNLPLIRGLYVCTGDMAMMPAGILEVVYHDASFPFSVHYHRIHGSCQDDEIGLSHTFLMDCGCEGFKLRGYFVEIHAAPLDRLVSMYNEESSVIPFSFSERSLEALRLLRCRNSSSTSQHSSDKPTKNYLRGSRAGGGGGGGRITKGEKNCSHNHHHQEGKGVGGV